MTRARASSPTCSPGDGRRRPLPGRPQRRAPHRGRRRGLRPPARSRAGILYPHVTPVIGNGVVVDPSVLLAGDRHARGQGRRHLAAAGLGQRAPDHAVPLRSSTGSPSATSARTRWGPPSAASARPTPTRPPRVGPARPGPARREDLPREARRRRCSEKNACSPRSTTASPFSASEIAEFYLDELAPRIAPMIADTVGYLHDALATRRSASCSRGPRRRSSTSTTAPIPSSRRRTRSRVAPARARASARATSARSSASPRPTSPASGAGPFPTELSTATWRAARRARPRVRHQHRTACAACGWFDAVMARQAVAAQLAHRDRADQARRPRHPRDDQGLRRPTRPTACATTTRPTTSRCCTGSRPVYEELPGWKTRHHRLHHLRRAARGGARATCSSSPSRSACRSASSASARAESSSSRPVVSAPRCRRRRLGRARARAGLGAGSQRRRGRRHARATPAMPAAARLDPASTARRPRELEADLFVIGPEQPLVEGLADELRAQGTARRRAGRATARGSRAPRPS